MKYIRKRDRPPVLRHERPVKKVRAQRGIGGVSASMANYIRNRDGGVCVYCQADAGAQIDHVLCVKHGGRSIKENLVLACLACNMKKKDRLCALWIARAFKHLLDVGESLDWVDFA